MHLELGAHSSDASFDFLIPICEPPDNYILSKTHNEQPNDLANPQPRESYGNNIMNLQLRLFITPYKMRRTNQNLVGMRVSALMEVQLHSMRRDCMLPRGAAGLDHEELHRTN